MTINVNNPPLHAVAIGRCGENEFRTVTIDVSAWLALWPEGKVSVIYRRPDGELYPVLVNATESPIVWRPTATDTAVAGKGALEVRITSGDVLGKSCTVHTAVAPALGDAGEAPAAPAPDWAQTVAGDADRAEAAADKAEAVSMHTPQISDSKTWLVWDADTDAYTDTGVSAAGASAKTAYQYAQEGGYAGTEAEFAQKLAQEAPALSVKEFGAVGDGSTDDTAAFQSAFDGAAGKGGNLYIPEGDYKITGPLTITDPIHITCDGWLKVYDSAGSADFVALTADNGVQIKGLKIEAQEGFAGVILKYYPTSNTIYPSRSRFTSLELQSLSTQKIVSYFDIYGGNNYGIIVEDVTIGKPNTARYCQYGMRILTEEGYAGAGASWENSGTVRNMRIDTRGDHQLYVVGATGGVVPKNWVFENIAIQANSKLQSGDAFEYQDSFYMYRFAEVTLRNCKVWDASSASYASGRAPVVYEDIIATTYIDGCAPAFYLDSGAVVLSKATTPEITAYRQQYAYDVLKELAEKFDISSLTITKAETDAETTLTFSDGTNTKSISVSKVQLTDDQISTAIGSWMDANATPTEVWSKNVLNVNDPDVSMGYIAAAGQINSNDSYWVSGYIPAKLGDVLRSSLNGATVNFYYVAEYDANKAFLVRQATSANTYTVQSESAAYIRVSWKTALLPYQDSGAMLTLNDDDLTFEAYGSHMEGGLGEYFVLTSPNGTKYTLSVADDGTLSAAPA